jgi:hypothetical protein
VVSLSFSGSKKKTKKKKKRKSRKKVYGIPKFDKDGKLQSWVKRRLK